MSGRVIGMDEYTNKMVNVVRHLVVMACLALIANTSVGANQRLPKMLTMYQGESRVINGVGVKRMSVGKTSIVSSTILESGEIVLIAESAGETNIQMWFEGGKRLNIPLVVIESNAWREALEVKALLDDVNGLSVNTVGSRIVVDGNVDKSALERIKTVKERYPDILILARELTEFEHKMLHFDVRITEVGKSEKESLGINWNTSFAGPTLSYENIWNAKNLGQPPAQESNPVAAALLGSGVTASELILGDLDPASGLTVGQQQQLVDASQRGYTYWGIGTRITSLINILESDGAAITLASPRLSSRSGGKATMTVGGEIPVVTSSVSGQSVSYKEYGIMLELEPTIDLENNISAKVKVEVSQVDLANTVGDQPAFAKRSTENDVKLAPGETLALAGIYTTEEQLAYTGIKWLSNIPILGNLFRSKAFTTGDSELVILITPTAINDPSQGVNNEMVNRAKELVDKFEEQKEKLSNF
tara:strand:+ start:81 stop:1508 length:1428 start_codon:yes stop_codon:yes gene_type:complete